jgi:hypothetical protein
MQFMENLTDRQTADAVRSRLDGKYTLSLEVTDAGWDYRVLREFRTRLVAHTAEERLFSVILDLCRERGWLKGRGKPRTDSPHVLAKVRALNRLECVGQTLAHALNVLALVAPNWVRDYVEPAWAERYAHRIEEYRLPKGKDERVAYANRIDENPGARRHQNQIRVYDVWSLSCTPTVYHLWPSAALRAPSSEIRGVYRCPTASHHQRVCRVVPPARRNRRDACPSGTSVWVTAQSVHWRATHASATRGHRRRHQPISFAELDHRHSARKEEGFSLPHSHAICGVSKSPSNSPPISISG